MMYAAMTGGAQAPSEVLSPPAPPLLDVMKGWGLSQMLLYQMCVWGVARVDRSYGSYERREKRERSPRPYIWYTVITAHSPLVVVN